MKLLVTGANGLLGSAICRVAESSNYDYEVIAVARNQCDLTNFQDTKAIFNFIKPDFVIHTAAIVGGIGSNMNHPGKFFCDNIAINTNVLESARLSKVKKLVSFMSTCVFPDNAIYPLNARDVHNGPPHPSNAAYAHAKRMLDVQSKAYRTEYGCNFITLIPTNIYGPHDNFDMENGHVLPSLIHRCYLAKEEESDLVVWGSGKPLREFVYADDIATLTLEAIDRYDKDVPLIISNGEERSIKEAVLKIAEILNFKRPIIFDESKPDGQFRKPSDIEDLQELVPDYQFVPFDVGLRVTVDWFVRNYPNVRSSYVKAQVDPYLQTR